MILTEENLSIRRKTCPGVTLSITDPTCSSIWVALRWKMGLGGETQITNFTIHGTPEINCNPVIYVTELSNLLTIKRS
jgi:hypothetical protein